MSSIRDRREKRSAIKKNEDLYNSIGVDPTLTITDEPSEASSELYSATPNVIETTEYKRVDRNRKSSKSLKTQSYDYQEMAVNFSKENVAQQLGNYRQSMEFLANMITMNGDDIVFRLQDLIYNFPNIDISSFVNKENAKVYSWIVQQMAYSFGEKYLGSMYILGGGMGVLSAMILDTKLRFETIRSFDINGSCQFLADEMMKKELLADWRFKGATQDLFNIDYAEHSFISQLQDGRLSDPFNEIPGTIINTNISYLKNYADWYDMIPEMRRVVLIGETGDVPRPFPSSQAFNKRFPMSFEVYSGVLNVDGKHFYMKMGYR